MNLFEHIKNNLLNICIACIYTILAALVYGIWSYSGWHLWYVTLIIVIVILGVGGTISYFWIRSEIRSKQKKEEKPVELEEPIVEKTEEE